jgi:nicotinamide riboside kinase
MKVYFVGSHSTGKTTCARYVSEKYKLPMITEVARAVLSEKELHLDSLRYDLNLVDDYQKQIFYRQLEEENKQRDISGSWVSDRSFDCLAYAAQHSRILADLIRSDKMKEYLEYLRMPDSLIFFVRPSKATLKADGVREAINWDGVVAIDAMVKFMLEMWELRYFQINIDNMQERVRLIDGTLGMYKSK